MYSVRSREEKAMSIAGMNLDTGHGSLTVTEGVRVEASPCFLPNHSNPDEGRYIFGYLIRVSNDGEAPVQLLERHWRIADANGETHEVRGEGVIGVQPRIEPGETHEYTSFCPLGTRWGTMEGSYLMVRDDDSVFDARVGRFYLVAEEDEVEKAREVAVARIDGDRDVRRAAVDLRDRHEAERARILREAPVVAHDDDVPLRHGELGERGVACDRGRDGDRVRRGADGLVEVEQVEVAADLLDVFGGLPGRRERDGGAVEDEAVVDHRDGVARDGDHALDEARPVLGRGARDDLARRRRVPAGDPRVREGHAQAVGELVHRDAVADEDGGLHGSGGDVVPVRDGAADRGEHGDGDEEGDDPVAEELSPLGFTRGDPPMLSHFTTTLATVANTATPAGTSQPAISFDSLKEGDFEQFWADYGPVLMTFAAKVVGVIVLLLVASIVAGWVSAVVYKATKKSRLDETLAKFFAKSSRWGILLLTFIACLGVFGVNTTSFAAIIGGAALAIGLAFQGSLSNLAAGVMLLLFRPFNVGQVVSVAGQTGTIDEIGLFVTEMDTFDNRRIIIPNSSVFGATIENISHHPVRRADVSVGTDYDADLDTVREVLEKAIASVPGQVEGRDPAVVLQDLGDSSINWSVRIWLNAEDFWPKKQELTRAVKVELDKAGIGIPFPQRVVTLVKDGHPHARAHDDGEGDHRRAHEGDADLAAVGVAAEHGVDSCAGVYGAEHLFVLGGVGLVGEEDRGRVAARAEEGIGGEGLVGREVAQAGDAEGARAGEGDQALPVVDDVCTDAPQRLGQRGAVDPVVVVPEHGERAEAGALDEGSGEPRRFFNARGVVVEEVARHYRDVRVLRDREGVRAPDERRGDAGAEVGVGDVDDLQLADICAEAAEGEAVSDDAQVEGLARDARDRDGRGGEDDGGARGVDEEAPPARVGLVRRFGRHGDLAHAERDHQRDDDPRDAERDGEAQVRGEGASVGELVEQFDISQPAVSKQLRVLREAGLVEAERDGRRRVYRLSEREFKKLGQWVRYFDRFWDSKLDALGRYLDEEHFYPHSPERVWVAITDPRAIAEWLMPNNFRAEVGAKFRFQVDTMPLMKKLTGVTECEVLECEPPRKLVYSWQIVWADESREPHGPMVISWELIPENGGTRLVFEHRGIENIPWIYRFMMSSGWGRMVKRLIPKIVENVTAEIAMNSGTKVVAGLCALGVAGVCGAVLDGHLPEKFAPAFSMPSGMSPEELASDPEAMAAMMAEWQAMNAPGDHHELLTYFTGEWTTETTMWVDKNQPPMVTEGTASAEMVIGGRFVHMEWTTPMMGVDMTGEGYIGHDNVSGRYQSMWMDSGTTAMRFLEGHSNRDGSEIAFYGKMDEPQLDIRDRVVAYVFRLIDADTYEMDVRDLHVGSDDNTVVKITFTRKNFDELRAGLGARGVGDVRRDGEHLSGPDGHLAFDAVFDEREDRLALEAEDDLLVDVVVHLDAEPRVEREFREHHVHADHAPAVDAGHGGLEGDVVPAQVVGLVGVSGEVFDVAPDARDERGGVLRAFGGRGDGGLEPLDTELLALGVGPFEEAVGDEDEGVAGGECDGVDLVEDGVGEDAQGEAVGAAGLDGPAGVAVNEDGAVAGADHADVAGAGGEQGDDKGDEAVRREVGGEQAVDAGDDVVQAEVRVDGGPGVGSAEGGDEGGPEPVSGDVGDGHGDGAVGEGLPVVVVAAGLVGGAVPAGDVVARDLGLLGGQEVALDAGGDVHLLLHALALLGLVELGVDVGRDAARDEGRGEAVEEDASAHGVEEDLREHAERGVELVGHHGVGQERGVLGGAEDARDEREPRGEVEDGEHDEGGVDEHGGRGEGLVGGEDVVAPEEGDGDGGDGALDDGVLVGQGAGDGLVAACAARDVGDAGELVDDGDDDGDDGDPGEVPARDPGGEDVPERDERERADGDADDAPRPVDLALADDVLERRAGAGGLPGGSVHAPASTRALTRSGWSPSSFFIAAKIIGAMSFVSTPLSVAVQVSVSSVPPPGASASVRRVVRGDADIRGRVALAHLAGLAEGVALAHRALGEGLDAGDAGRELGRVAEVGDDVEDGLLRRVDGRAGLESAHVDRSSSRVPRVGGQCTRVRRVDRVGAKTDTFEGDVAISLTRAEKGLDVRRFVLMCVFAAAVCAGARAQDRGGTYEIETIGPFEGLSGEALTREDVLGLRVLLVRVGGEGGALVAPGEAGEGDGDAEPVVVTIADLGGERLSAGAVRAALEAVPAAYAAKGYRGILVTVDEAALAEGRLELSFLEGRVGEVRSLLRREGDEAVVNDPRAERLRARVPARASSGDEPGSLVDLATLDGFAHQLSRHPNRRADIALSPGPRSGNEGDLTLDLLLTESAPLLLYAQASNTGTEETSEWRERFGLTHFNLTNSDDILTLDYVTGSFEGVHAAIGSYEAPLDSAGRVRGRVDALYSRYDASELGVLLVDFRGETASAGAEVAWNVYQRGPAFVDLFAGARFEYHEVENNIGIETDNTFLIPTVGVRFEQRTDAWSLDASLALEFNWASAGGTDESDIDLLGRFDTDADFALLVYDATWSAYLDALLGEGASRVHEIAFGARGRVSFDDRLPPGFTDVVGGFYTVRGYPEAFASGDRSVIASAEYRFHLPRALTAYGEGEGPGELFGDEFYWRPAHAGGLTDWDLVLRTFVDIGWVGTVDALPFEGDETLIGAGVGVELSIKRTFSARLDWAWALRDAETADDRVDSGDNELHLVFTTRMPLMFKSRDAHRPPRARAALALLACLAGGTLSAPATAGNGEGVRVDRVVRGSAQLTRNGALTSITASDGAIINFGRFDIARNEAVRFVQPGESARVLGRILSGTPSQINGALSANGSLYLVNPAGIVFGRGSVVDVGKLYAAAGNITDAEFIAGVDRFTASDGAVVNRGVISGRDAVHLIGKRAENYGSIVAPNGVVTLSAGDEVFLGESGGRVMVRVDASAPAPGEGSVGVVHGGEIEARDALFTVGDVYSIAMTRNSSVRASGGVLVEADRGETVIEGSVEVASTDDGGETPVPIGFETPRIIPELLPDPNIPASIIIVFGGTGDINLGHLNAGTIYLDTTGAINAFSLTAGSQIFLRASAMSFGMGPNQDDVVRGSGTLTILPVSGTELFLGVPGLNPGDVPGLVLPQSELDAIRPGFSLIRFGDQFTSGVTIGGPGSTIVFEDPVEFRTNAPNPAHFVRVNGTLRGLDDGRFTFMTTPGRILLDGTVETAGGEVFFGYPFAPFVGIGATLLGDSRVDTTFGGAAGGRVTFTGAVDGPFSLALNAGDAPAVFGGNIGGAAPLTGFALESASVANLANRTIDTTAGAGGVFLNAGALDLSGAALAFGAGDAELAFGTLAFDAGTMLTGDALVSDVTVRGRTGAETLGLSDASADVDLDLTLLDGVTAARFVVGGASQTGDLFAATDADVDIANFSNTVRLETTGRTTLAGELAVVGGLEIASDVRVGQDASGTLRGAGVEIDGDIDGTTGSGAERLTLDARGGSFALAGTVSGFEGVADATGLADVSFVNGQSLSLDGVSVSGTVETDLSGPVSASGRVSAGALDLIASAIGLNAGFDVAGGVAFGAPATIGGAVSTAGGDVTTGDLTLTGAGIDAGNGAIGVLGDLGVQSDATLSGATVTLAGATSSTNGSDLAIDGDASFAQDVTDLGLLAVDGTTLFGANVGTVSAGAMAFNGETTVLAPSISLDAGTSVAFNAGLFSGTGNEASPIRTALTVNAPETLFAQGAGDADGREFSLIRTTGAGTTRIGGTLRAIGDGTPATGVRLDGDAALDGAIDVTGGAINLGGDLLVEGDSFIRSHSGPGIVIAGDADSAAGEANDLTLLVNALGVASMDEIPVIVLGGDAGASGAFGDLILNTTVLGGTSEDPVLESRRDGVPRVATVVFGDVTLNADGTHTVGAITPEGAEAVGAARIVADRFITGFGEKITALGSIDIQTGTLAAVGDISTLNDLIINSGGSVLLLLRDDAPVRTSAPRDGIENPTSIAELEEPPVDRGTGYASGGLLLITGDVRTMTDPNATNARPRPTFASLAALVEPMTITVDGRPIRVTPIDFGISIGDLRLDRATFAELSNDVLLDLFIQSAGGPIAPVTTDPSGQDPLTDERIIEERARDFATGPVLNRYDRATLARYGVPTRLVATGVDRWEDVLLYDDRDGGAISADRIWAINARSFVDYVVMVFEEDEAGMAAFRERLASAFVGSDAAGVARVSETDGTLASGFAALAEAIDRLGNLGLTETEFERSRSLLLALHVVTGGVSEAQVLDVLSTGSRDASTRTPSVSPTQRRVGVRTAKTGSIGGAAASVSGGGAVAHPVSSAHTQARPIEADVVTRSRMHRASARSGDDSAGPERVGDSIARSRSVARPFSCYRWFGPRSSRVLATGDRRGDRLDEVLGDFAAGGGLVASELVAALDGTLVALDVVDAGGALIEVGLELGAEVGLLTLLTGSPPPPSVTADIGRLLGIQLFDVAKDDDVSVILGEFFDLFPDDPLEFLAFEAFVDPRADRLSENPVAGVVEGGEQAVEGGAGGPLVLAEAGEGGVHHDPVEPRGEFRVALEGVDVLPRAEDAVLEGVAGVVLVAGDAPGRGEEARAELAEDVLHRGLVPGLEPLNKLSLPGVLVALRGLGFVRGGGHETATIAGTNPMRPTTRRLAPILAALAIACSPATAADESLMDPTIDGAPRAALVSSVGHLLPAETGKTEWIVPDEMGGEASLESFEGEVLVLQSFDTSNARSRAAMRRLIAAMGTARDLDGVTIVGVHTPKNSETASRIVRTQMKNIPVLIDHSGHWCDEVGIYETPTTIVVDRAGVIRHAGINLTHVREVVTELAGEAASTTNAKPLPARDARVKAVPTRAKATAYPAPNPNVGRATNVQGKKAPDITAEKWHTGIPNTEGKVIVVEFWATWCGPCIKNMPHLNKLAKDFRDSVVIVGMSDESAQKVSNFVRSRGLSYVIGSDPQRRLFRFANPAGIPYAWVQSPDGIVRWQGHPARLTEELLEQIVEASGAGEGPEESGRWVTDASECGDRLVPALGDEAPVLRVPAVGDALGVRGPQVGLELDAHPHGLDRPDGEREAIERGDGHGDGGGPAFLEGIGVLEPPDADVHLLRLAVEGPERLIGVDVDDDVALDVAELGLGGGVALEADGLLVEDGPVLERAGDGHGVVVPDGRDGERLAGGVAPEDLEDGLALLEEGDDRDRVARCGFLDDGGLELADGAGRAGAALQEREGEEAGEGGADGTFCAVRHIVTIYSRTMGMCAKYCGLAVLLALGGCEQGSMLDFSGPQNTSTETNDSILTLFSGPTPVQAVQMATNTADPDERVRGTLLLANAPWGGEDVYLRLYREHMADEDAGVRAVAIRALSLHGTPDDVPAIVEQLKNGNDVVREEAARALQRIHAPEAIQPLLAASDIRQEENWKVRQYASVALGQYAERRVVDKLIDSLTDHELSVNRAALRSLRILTGQDLGFNTRAWLTWVNSSGELFAGRGVYEYPVFQREPNMFEAIVPWLEVPNEEPASPVGMERLASRPAPTDDDGGTCRVENVETLADEPGYAIVTMSTASVCLDDVRVAKEMRADDPMTMGREGVGVVASVGEGDDDSLVGTRVTFESSFPCRTCELCKKGLSAHCRERVDLGEEDGLEGCFAEAVKIPVKGLVKAPEALDDERVLCARVFALARHAGQRVRIDGRPYITILGDTREALVMGQVMSRLNAQVRVISWKDERLALCEKWGIRHRHADEPGLHADQDVVIDCAGTYESVEMTMAMIRPRGTVLATVEHGLLVHATSVVGKELDVLGTGGGTIAEGLALLADSAYQTAGLFTKRSTMDNAVEAVHAMALDELGATIEF
ncbi:mscS [Symbiodinium necroappetens]|uniref:MscS protein n=1 Tax=Symbiodinium necroappetens TaxID=1628268 RepID=A0A812MGP1_9DINO|nr:mscS [Symbiodinium necroappetens]